jgi:hypothetical protein
MSARCVSADTLLVVRSWNGAGVVVLDVTGRLLGVDGLIRPFTFVHVPKTDRSQAETTYQLIAGTLLDVSVTPRTGTPRHGQCYVTIGLALSVQPTTTYYELLAKGYVTPSDGLLWPGGLYLDSVEGTGFLSATIGADPAAGAEIVYQIPLPARWRIRGAIFNLVTSATVIARTVNLTIDLAGTVLYNFPGTTTQAASLTRTYNLAEYAYQPAAVGSSIFFAIPFNLVLSGGWYLRTVTTNLQAGDDFGAPVITYEEWIEA